jgi:hypothetical protein
MAVLVWRHLVHDLTDYVVVRRAVLDFASCRYWMQRLAVEAETGTAARRPLVARTDKVWPLWHRLAEEIRAAEESDA